MVRMITQDFEGRMRVHMVDSRTLSMGLGMMVLAAARALRRAPRPRRPSSARRPCAETSWACSSFARWSFCARAGAIGKVEGVVGSLLQIKPIIYATTRASTPRWPRRAGTRSAVDTMVGEVKRFLGGAKAELSVVNGKAREEAEKLMERLRSELDVTGETTSCPSAPCWPSTRVRGCWALWPTGRTRPDRRRIERQVGAGGLRPAQHARLGPDGVCVQHHL